MNSTKHQMDLIDIYIEHSIQQQQDNTFFLSTQAYTNLQVDHMFGHKTSLNKLRRLNYIKYLFQQQWYDTRNQ